MNDYGPGCSQWGLSTRYKTEAWNLGRPGYYLRLMYEVDSTWSMSDPWCFLEWSKINIPNKTWGLESGHCLRYNIPSHGCLNCWYLEDRTRQGWGFGCLEEYLLCMQKSLGLISSTTENQVCGSCLKSQNWEGKSEVQGHSLRSRKVEARLYYTISLII